MTTAVPENACPECGSSVAAQGLCARCLLEGAAAPTNPGETRSNPPGIDEVAAAFPQLEVLELIGHGGMGSVFKVRQPKLNRLAALKLLPQSLASDAAFAARFEREARLLGRLSHPNITAVFDYGQAGEFFYLLMEYVDGVNLRQAMRASRFTPTQALRIVPKICEALEYAHEEGVLHRDIKPENILLDAKGRVKLADFGIAKIVAEADHVGSEPVVADSSATHGGLALGTPQYMAPEQRDDPGAVDHRADIYSLGVVFYELLTGELPVGKFAPPSTLSATDPRVDAIVQQALEKERERRQRSAGEMRTQVETVRSSAPAVIPAPPAADPVVCEKLRRKVAIPAIGLMIASGVNVLLFTGLLCFAFFFMPWETTPEGDVARFASTGASITFSRDLAATYHPAANLLSPVMLFGIFPSLITFFGARAMWRFRGYGMAVAGALLGMFTPPGLILGFIFGIWGLVVLTNSEVQRAFRANPIEPKERLKIPAYGMMAVSAINLLLLGQLLSDVLFGAAWKTTPEKDVLSYTHDGWNLGIETPPTGIHPGLLTVTPVVLLLAIVPIVTLLGARRMRELKGYGLATAGSILSIVTPLGMFGGTIFGLWGLITLSLSSVRESFDSGMPRPRLTGWLGALGIVAGVILLFAVWIVGFKLLFPATNWHCNFDSAASKGAFGITLGK